eukprot:CAMPEP_0175157818 /NCGR_PEP_ID=MMETSP0087-20121206/22443_1 /TAXON_ID=136419 /ORGANISM="Unknown Unknown, Strain D1" /LENGTH=40 /DNA_ID= /DNA_START= /DNA_END= /DNA_ORIENTATION=
MALWPFSLAISRAVLPPQSLFKFTSAPAAIKAFAISLLSS